jgi:hypothetical protein
MIRPTNNPLRCLRKFAIHPMVAGNFCSPMQKYVFFWRRKLLYAKMP